MPRSKGAEGGGLAALKVGRCGAKSEMEDDYVMNTQKANILLVIGLCQAVKVTRDHHLFKTLHSVTLAGENP